MLVAFVLAVAGVGVSAGGAAAQTVEGVEFRAYYWESRNDLPDDLIVEIQDEYGNWIRINKGEDNKVPVTLSVDERGWADGTKVRSPNYAILPVCGLSGAGVGGTSRGGQMVNTDYGTDNHTRAVYGLPHDPMTFTMNDTLPNYLAYRHMDCEITGGALGVGPLVGYGDTDTDGDGLTDQEEQAEAYKIKAFGYSPQNRWPFASTDADGDGLPDGVEGLADTDGDRHPDFIDDNSDNSGPIDGDPAEGLADTDGDGTLNYKDDDNDNDGMSDFQEGIFKTDINNPDSDGDGLSDGLEMLTLESNPLSSDTDGDGYGDKAEYDAGTDLRDASDNPGNPTTTTTTTPTTTTTTTTTTTGGGVKCVVQKPNSVFAGQVGAHEGASTWRLYQAFFLRQPDQGGFDYWLGVRANGSGLVSIANYFSQSEEFRLTYGSLNDADFVSQLYRNIFCREPDAGGHAYWTGRLTSGDLDRGGVVIQFSESQEYLNATATAHAYWQ